MAEELKDQRVVVLMTASESTAIDDWSYANRIRSKGEAIRRLTQLGLAVSDRVPALMAFYRDAQAESLAMPDKPMRVLLDIISGRNVDQPEEAFDALAHLIDRALQIEESAIQLSREILFINNADELAAEETDSDLAVSKLAEFRKALEMAYPASGKRKPPKK